MDPFALLILVIKNPDVNLALYAVMMTIVVQKIIAPPKVDVLMKCSSAMISTNVLMIIVILNLDATLLLLIVMILILALMTSVVKLMDVTMKM
jgi:hypothetical protein